MPLIPSRKSTLLLKWFRSYNLRYLRKSFHAVHVLGEPPRVPEGDHGPLLICLNHSAWWDLLLGLYVGTELLESDAFAVMDAGQLARYRFFSRLGIIGVDRSSLTGAKEFLRYAEGLLTVPDRALFLTVQGEMGSNYVRPIEFQPGVAHLVERLRPCFITTMLFHYEFWNDRSPEAFISFSPAVPVPAAGVFNRRDFLYAQEQAMEASLGALLALVERRDSSLFRTALTGGTGASPLYDAVRTLGARITGREFHAAHSDVGTPRWRDRRRKS